MAKPTNGKHKRKGNSEGNDILAKTFGMWKTKETGLEYTRRIRAGWGKRLRRLYGRRNL